MTFNFKEIKLDDEKNLLILKNANLSNQYLNEILFKIPVGVIVFSKLGKVAFYNHNFIELWGIKEEDLIDYNILKMIG